MLRVIEDVKNIAISAIRNEEKSFGYTLEGDKYHIFVYEEKLSGENFWMVEPNIKTPDDECVPCGQIEAVPYGNILQLISVCKRICKLHFR